MAVIRKLQATGRTACRIVMNVSPMMAVTVSEKPASFALPVSESVNFVEKIVTGANAASTTISWTRSSNGRRSHADSAMMMLNRNPPCDDFAQFRTVFVIVGNFHHQADHGHCCERVGVGERRDQCDDPLRYGPAGEHEYQHEHVAVERVMFRPDTLSIW